MNLQDLNTDENLIRPLYARLSQLAQQAQEDEVRFGKPFTHEVIIQADEDTPFQVLVKVLYTCGQSEYNKLRLLTYQEK
jgi:biopolymer transport protein ExbD